MKIIIEIKDSATLGRIEQFANTLKAVGISAFDDVIQKVIKEF